MPVIQNLKDFIHRHNNNSAGAAAPSSSSTEASPPRTSGGGSGSTTHRHHHKTRSVPTTAASPVNASAYSTSPPRNQAAMDRQAMPPPAQPPLAAQNAPFAAYNPEPATKSTAGHFAGVNPAAAQPEERHAKGGGAPSPAAMAIGGDAVAQHGEQAQQMIDKARAAKAKMPIYEGLPDHFSLLEKMGDGAFSNVYKAVDRRTGQKVAIKCVRKYELNRSQGKHLNPDLKKKPRATERANILKEVSIMRNLNHPNIVRLISFTESREHYFLVLELMEGGELFHQIVKLTYFSEELARHVILQVAHGIRYLHEEKGVVHRDIKPENLLFEAIPIIPSKHSKARPYDEEKEDEGEFVPALGGGGIGQVKIADFGLSKIVWQEDTATPCGTVGYTAPEIVKDERYSKSVDMWALGCVLYTLLCGFPPFFDESIQVLTEKVARGYYTFLSPWWDDISASSKDLISHLLCVDPEKRFTIDEFLAHPWCKARAPPPNVNKQDLAALAPHVQRARQLNYAPLDSPLLHAQAGGGNARTPGVHQLREAFDVTYAVHRMEEEGARRAKYGGTGGQVLHGLNEEDEDNEEESIREREQHRRRYGHEVSQAIEDQRRAVAARQQAGGQQQQTTGHYQGWGGANRHEAEAALYGGRAGTRDRGGRGRGFELNMNNATLLGRRKGPIPTLA